MLRNFSIDKLLHYAFEISSGAWNRLSRNRDRGDGGLPRLLQSGVTARADIEFTTRCNLRCVYCASQTPTYRGGDLDSAYLGDILECLKRRQVVTLGVSGHGETTTVANWQHYCDRMLDNGLDLYLSTNLARELSGEEIATLSRFHIIQVSCDTADLALFKKLRRGADFLTVVYNMERIRSRSILDGRRMPIFWWHCVVSDQTVWKLEEHVAYGLALGVKLFNFINLVVHPDLEECPAGLITDMPRYDLERHQRHYAIQKPGMTRDCMDPWSYLKVASNSGVMPCCRTVRPVGFLSDGLKLDDILNNSEMKQFRESLLTGDLKDVCRTCNIRGWTEIDKLKFKVNLFLKFGKYLPVLHRWGILLPLLHRWRRSEL
jgi:hypothetical protein